MSRARRSIQGLAGERRGMADSTESGRDEWTGGGVMKGTEVVDERHKQCVPNPLSDQTIPDQPCPIRRHLAQKGRAKTGGGFTQRGGQAAEAGTKRSNRPLSPRKGTSAADHRRERAASSSGQPFAAPQELLTRRAVAAHEVKEAIQLVFSAFRK